MKLCFSLFVCIFLDAEEPKFRQHEQEAARSLLSLAQTPAGLQNALNSPNLLIPGQPMTYPYEGNQQRFFQSEAIKVSLYEGQMDIATTPELPQQPEEQNRQSSHYDTQTLNDAMPIDLTKPRTDDCDSERRLRKMTPTLAPVTSSYAGTAGVLNSLINITDHIRKEKVPAIASPLPLTPGHEYPILSPLDVQPLTSTRSNNDILLETYITERAMQNSKMKQSQMHRVINPSIDAYDRNIAAIALNKNKFIISQRVIDTGSNEHVVVSDTSGSSILENPNKFIDERSLLKAAENAVLPDNSKLKQRGISIMQTTDEKHEIPTKKLEVSLSAQNFPEINNTFDNNIAESKVDEEIANTNRAKEVEVAQQPITNVITITSAEPGETLFRIEIPVEAVEREPIEGTGDMLTLAEIAASSQKLDTNRPVTPLASNVASVVTATAPLQNTSDKNQKQHEGAIIDSVNVLPPAATTTSSPGNNAKTVASEYLKKSSAEYLKAHQFNLGADSSSNIDDSADKAFIPSATDDSCGSSDLDNAEVISSKKLGTQASMLGLQNISDRSSAAGSSLISARTVVVGGDGFKSKSTSSSSDLPVVTFPLGGNASAGGVRSAPAFIQEDGGRSVCAICSKTFLKKHQMVLHMNIHYMTPRKFRCEPCAVNFRTQGHLQKHERSEAHKTKVIMTTTFGQVTTRNPRPFECSDCKIAFRIHGHLAKHLRSKTHVQKLECLQKLPFGTYAEIERAGISLTDIDTSDCDNSLASLRSLAQKLLLDKDSGDDKSNSTPNWTQTSNTFSPCDENRERTESMSEEGEIITNSDGLSIKLAMDANEDVSMENRRKVSICAMDTTTDTFSDGSEKNVDKMIDDDDDGGGDQRPNNEL